MIAREKEKETGRLDGPDEGETVSSGGCGDLTGRPTDGVVTCVHTPTP